MTEQPQPDDRQDHDPGMAPEDAANAGTPRWVKVFGLVTLVVVLLLVILLLAGGDHGPGRHVPADGRGGHTPPVQHP